MASSSTMKGFIGDGERLHVLAVDDSFVDRKLTERLLTTSSCKVTMAENGQMALELLGLGEEQRVRSLLDSKVDLIITDYDMPGITGLDLLKKVKESWLKEIPVVIVSAENNPKRMNKCLEEGAETYLLKPLKKADVAVTIQQIYARSSRN